MKILIIFLIAASFTYSQQQSKANNIAYVEIFGKGKYFSVNYERMSSHNVSLQIGLGNMYESSTSNLQFFPYGMINYLIEIYGNNYFEIGTGILLNFKFNPTFVIGYRFSPGNGGIFFNAVLNTFLSSERKFVPWGSIGVGYRF